MWDNKVVQGDMSPNFLEGKNAVTGSCLKARIKKAIDRIVLRHAFEELPGGCRQTFNLHEVEGYAHHEIAEPLGSGGMGRPGRRPSD